MKIEIQNFVNEKFHPEAKEFVFSILNKVLEDEWGVGKEQLAMSLLKLSNGSLDKLLSYFPIVDPRDVIMEAV